MAISVVIPVYNAEEFIQEAVLSALKIKEVQQIILVEDTSPDNCLAICQRLQLEHPDKVELYTHPQGTRQGAAASRNLGIGKATGEYIAFLDADDYYLPQRFDRALKIFQENKQIDYVVSPSQLESDFLNGVPRYTMMGREANNFNYNLFPALLTEKYGYFDTNSILVKRASLERLSALFNPKLELHQDSELWLRIAYKLNGYTENDTLPGSVVRRHNKNRITHRNASSLRLYWETVFSVFQDKNLSPHLNRFIRLKKSHYQCLYKQSLLSHWYAIGVKLQMYFFPSDIWIKRPVLNGYIVPEVDALKTGEMNVLSS